MAPHKEVNTYFKRSIRKGRINGFTIYCKQLCKQSLITGFPVVASTRNLLRRVIKVLVFMGCMCGFLYQTSEFLRIYMAYPTMVDIQIERPTAVDTPALSFCNANRIRRKVLCTHNASYCSWFTTRNEFCAIYPKYCIGWESETRSVLGIPRMVAFQETNRSREYVQKLGESFKDFIGGCAVLAQISLLLKPQQENYLGYYDLVLVHILLHEAHGLANPFMEGTAMEVGKTYNVFVNQRVTKRLPAPYQTNCTDYLKLWKKNGGYGPLTGKACAEHCKMVNMLETNGCVAQSVNYPGNFPICEDEQTYPSDDIIKKCSLHCKDACSEVSYSMRHEIAYDQSKKCGKDENCMFNDIHLNFIFNRMEVQKSVHQPRYESVEMFSYIGGYMGMWLGISLVALFDFAETLLYLSAYMIRKKRKKKAVHSYY